MKGKTTRRRARWVALWLGACLAFGGALYVRARYGGVVFFTQDSFSYLNLAADLAQLKPPHLESYADVGPVNPWPLAYPALLALVSATTAWDGVTSAYVLQALLLCAVIGTALKLGPGGGVVLALASDSCLWLLGHAWAEGFFILGSLLTALTIDRVKPIGSFAGAGLALHARQPAFPALLAGLFFGKRMKRPEWGIVAALAGAVSYYILNAWYTGRPFGAVREPVLKDQAHWWQQAGQSLVRELCLLRDSDSLWLVGLQVALLLWLMSRGSMRSEGSRFLVGSGLGYGLVTLASHGLIRFAEDLDTRLLGPATVLILAGLWQDIRLQGKWVLALVLAFVLASLPYRALLPTPVKLEAPHPTPYTIRIPTWAPPMPIPERNPMTVEGIALGRALFFDKRLSGNGQTACANCHRPGMAYAQRGVARVGTRNTPSLLNVGWQPRLFWDGGVTNLESVALAPLHSSSEMGGTIVSVRSLMRTDPKYRRMVKAAFGTDTAESLHFLRALAQFQRTLILGGTRADAPASTWSGKERIGLALFTQSCAGCHPRPFYTDFGYHVITKTPGSPLQPVQNLENGRFRITQRLQDLGAYKTPSLRNVATTSPYMHDGSVETLDGCLSHGQLPIPRLGAQNKLDTNQVRAALLAYLRALSDTLEP